ncbi:transcriptional regulator AbrB (plasmid) [Acetobacter pasteurianus NBRC 101655]|uniref:type II toxin-antitoxin system PrlF family antitoxin n=1 Tax=Acetobacter pasteurianus TaxID=438 RepID=UPI0003842F8C|nr:type II toxin-antitoxin system PrlF family antitoxin [Acetobacter pasteurianus]BAU39899.1 transcriptional regulator AbrB [Acetobacter pasteurianus NBRC 101655]CCT60813.1 transcriptional regulator AbrB [Acetobacter pasteurianus 386B]
MVDLLKAESTITAKGQTTIPKSVRKALGVDYGGRIAFVVDDQRRVHVEKATEETSDPVVERFLEFLEKDMLDHSRPRLVNLPASLPDRVAALVANMDVDLDDEIEGDVAL